MAYNRENILQRMVDIQDIVNESKRKKGSSQKWVYENIIYPQYRISYDCFNKYISYPAKMELKKLLVKKQKEKELKDLQLKLF